MRRIGSKQCLEKMANKKKNYKVTAEYKCKVETVVEAKDEKEAERLALPELDDTAMRNVSCVALRVEETEQEPE